MFGADNPLTHLQPVLQGIDPDDSFSSVPYEKGAAFLYYIESLVGGASKLFLTVYSLQPHEIVLSAKDTMPRGRSRG